MYVCAQCNLKRPRNFHKVYELIFPLQELIFPVQEFRNNFHMPLRAAEKSHMPFGAKHWCSNMAARSGRTSLIRERNERGFRHFLPNLKAVFDSFCGLLTMYN